MVVMESNTRLKYLIYGYFRHITDDFIPSVITDICLKFYDSSDRWNKSLMSDNVIIYNNDCIKLTSHSLARIYLINTIDTGIYKWTFKLICYHSVDSQVLNIGIHKIAIKSSVQKDNWNQIPNSGYLFDFDDARASFVHRALKDTRKGRRVALYVLQNTLTVLKFICILLIT
eukprot:220773_1